MFKQITEIKSLEIIIRYLMFKYNVFVVTESRNKTITIIYVEKKVVFSFSQKKIYISVIGCFNIKIFLSIIFILLMVLFLLFVKIKTTQSLYCT